MSQTFCPECGRLHEGDGSACPQPPLVGQTLPGGILVRERLGENGLGAAYRAEAVDSELELQLVFLHNLAGTAQLQRSRLAAAAAIVHPNVAAVRALGETEDGVPYVAFEVVQGRLLSEILETRSVLPVVETLDLILQAAAGLQAAHDAHVHHGGLSPETILVTGPVDGRPLVKLIRFGLTEPVVDPSAPDPSLPYMPPERLAGYPPSVPGDVFSLGAVLHHMLTGAPPRGGEDWAAALPAAGLETLTGALAPDPQHRYQSAGEFMDSLRHSMASRGSARGRRTRWWAERRRRVAVAGAAATVAGSLALWASRGTPGVMPVRLSSGETGAAIPSLPPDSVSPTAGTLQADVARARPKPSRVGRATPTEQQTARATVVQGPATGPTVMAERDEADDSADVPAGDRASSSRASPLRSRSPVASLPTAAGPDSVRGAPLRAPAEDAHSTSVAAAGAAAAESVGLSSGIRPTAAGPRPEPASPSAVAVPARAIAATGADGFAAAREAAGRTLASYARALEANDLRAVAWVYPMITERERTAWKKFFGVARDLSVTLEIERFTSTGSETRLDVRGTYRYWNRTLHRPEEAPVRFLATVRRDGDMWHLSSIR